MSIAYQGEPGAFSEAAALQIDGEAILVPCRSFEDVFESVKGGPAGHGLLPLRSFIQDYELNVARLIVIGRRPISAETPDKTTLVFTLPKGPGTLFKALSVFALRGIDLTKLESRPIPNRKWEYLFYADVAAARDELPCGRALAHLAEFAPMLRVLGSYPSYKPAPGGNAGEPAVRPFEVLA